MQQGQGIAARGILRLKALSMEHKLKMRQNLPRKDKTLRTQMEQSSEYYAKKLKYPKRLRDDPQWHAEKAYNLKLRQYQSGRLHVQYFERAHNQIYLVGRDIPMAKVQPLNEEEHDDTFDNFTKRKFVELPTNRFYDETLEHSFTVSQEESRQRLRTDPAEPTRSPPILTTDDSHLANSGSSPSIQLKKNFRSFIDDKRQQLIGPQRGRSLTSSLINNLVVRDRRFTKLSKGSERVMKDQSSLKVELAELDYGSSTAKLRSLTQIPEGPIPKQAVMDKLLQRYGAQLMHLPLRCYRRDINLHLKSTIDSFNEWNWVKINRMAFDFYDSNKNGLLDEEDLLKMLELSEKVRAVGDDYNKLQYYLKRFDNNVRDPPLSPSRSGASLGKRLSRLSRISMATITEDESRLLCNASQPETALRRSPQLWTMKKENQPEGSLSKHRKEKPTTPTAANRPSKQICINVERFQEIYRFTRPQIYYDLVGYLFGYVRQVPPKRQFLRRPAKEQYTEAPKSMRQGPEFNQETIDFIRRRLQDLRVQCHQPLVAR